MSESNKNTSNDNSANGAKIIVHHTYYIPATLLSALAYTAC